MTAAVAASAVAGDAAVSDVAEETHALVRAAHCAQVGDNLVDQVREPVGTAGRTRDELWSTVATMSGVPMKSRSMPSSSTPGAQPKQRLTCANPWFPQNPPAL